MCPFLAPTAAVVGALDLGEDRVLGCSFQHGLSEEDGLEELNQDRHRVRPMDWESAALDHWCEATLQILGDVVGKGAVCPPFPMEGRGLFGRCAKDCSDGATSGRARSVRKASEAPPGDRRQPGCAQPLAARSSVGDAPSGPVHRRQPVLSANPIRNGPILAQGFGELRGPRLILIHRLHADERLEQVRRSERHWPN